MCRGVKQPQKGEDIGCLGHWPPWGWPDSHMDTVATVRELELHSTGCGFLRLTEPLSRLSVQLVSQTPKLSRLKAIFSQRPAGRQLGGKPAVCTGTDISWGSDFAFLPAASPAAAPEAHGASGPLALQPKQHEFAPCESDTAPG